ncbi:uncharacterized protein [Euwallacea fornicatus]|uniref:uncharacterized protein n=1 Tax=Euwallacea fornicatus TaxID=995702 RepID=UPI00338E859F
MANKCKDCGCSCKRCMSNDQDIQLHVEIENLKQRLVEKENHIVMMETNFLNEANKFPTGELGAMKEELLTWQDKYKRLYEAHRRVQRVNQGLEDKLLKLVDVCETDKSTLTRDVATLSRNLAEANYAVKKLMDDNERYKKDVSLAIQFLQCKQTNYVAHRFDSLPPEVQTQVSVYMNNKRKPTEEKARVSQEPKSIKVPIPTFPPTAMVYSVPKSPKELDRRSFVDDPEQPQVDIVSAAIMAKVLEERQKERALAKHCDTCTCAKNLKIIYEVSHHHVGMQTGNEYRDNVCLKCNELLSVTGPPVVVKSTEEKPARRTSPYPNLVVPLPVCETNATQNVVKVQPNNYCLIEKAQSSPKSIGSELKIVAVENSLVQTKELIDFNEASGDEKHDQEKRSPEVPPTHTSPTRLQSGSNNILLDNAQNTVTPVLFTQGISEQHYSQQPLPTSLTKPDSSISSYDSKRMSVVSENSTQHQKRIDDWVQITLDNDNVSSPENSRMEDMKIDARTEREIKLDKARYAEMEENVKRFLFGESDFWKTVEIGKLKYKSYQESEKGRETSREGSRTSSHTETEI